MEKALGAPAALGSPLAEARFHQALLLKSFGRRFASAVPFDLVRDRDTVGFVAKPVRRAAYVQPC
ncbi:MAG TPA: hypothetical protein VK789_16305 [Bryobacteraceae bacterium]|jgi:hypothetical protein|nr:hypothetical protein [Bryobacteraceae bacterium]